jgi:hypothetical protein
MNAKLAKRARKLARKLSVGMAPRELLGNKNTAVNNPQTTRGIYRQIKRFIRLGKTLTQIEENAL